MGRGGGFVDSIGAAFPPVAESIADRDALAIRVLQEIRDQAIATAANADEADVHTVAGRRGSGAAERGSGNKRRRSGKKVAAVHSHT